MKKLICWLMLVLLTPLTPVSACCMVPKNYAGTISQNAQQAIVFHHAGREELILRIDYKITGEKMPNQFAWVITVPQEPDAYAEADEDIYAQVSDWALPLVTPPPRSQGGGCGFGCSEKAKDDDRAIDKSLEFGRRVVVGSYDIQPVRARGELALEALNGWLEDNGFPTEDPQHMTYFIEQKFTFLCIKVSPPEGEQVVESGGNVKPLQLSFETEQLYYPLRFSSRQGVFDLQIVTLTSEPLDYDASEDSLQRINFSTRGLHRNVPVKTSALPEVLGKASKSQQFKAAPDKWYLNVLRCNNVNRGESIATWDEDIFLVTNKEAPVHQAARIDPEYAWLILIGMFLWIIRQVGSKLRSAKT